MLGVRMRRTSVGWYCSAAPDFHRHLFRALNGSLSGLLLGTYGRALKKEHEYSLSSQDLCNCSFKVLGVVAPPFSSLRLPGKEVRKFPK